VITWMFLVMYVRVQDVSATALTAKRSVCVCWTVGMSSHPKSCLLVQLRPDVSLKRPDGRLRSMRVSWLVVMGSRWMTHRTYNWRPGESTCFTVSYPLPKSERAAWLTIQSNSRNTQLMVYRMQMCVLCSTSPAQGSAWLPLSAVSESP